MDCLKVYYGYSILNNTVKHRSLRVLFENERHNPAKNEAFVRKAMKLVHERFQTKEEMTDAPNWNRIFSCYELFIEKKPFYGDIDKVLQTNFDADKNHVSAEELEEIRRKLRKAYFDHYGLKDERKQLKINF